MRSPVGLKKDSWLGHPVAKILIFLLLFSGLFAILLGPEYSSVADAQDGNSGADSITFSVPEVAPVGVDFSQEIEATGRVEQPVELRVAGESYPVEPGAFEEADSGMYVATVEGVSVPETGEFAMSLLQGGNVISEGTANAIWGWLTLLPPLLAIGIALISRQVIPSLVLGIYVGAVTVYGFSLGGLWYGLLDTIEVYIAQAIVPPSGDIGHVAIILFTLLMGGLIGIVYKNGGAYGIADRVSRFASNPRRGQLATSGLGFGIFFSTYANSLVIGNTMRPVTDRLRISREKLAYIVDSTAAPLAAIAIISTWIGFELGLIETSVGGISFDQGAYSIFLNSLPYNFYPIWALLFVLAVGFTGRDYGPMLKAERRARNENKLLRDGADVDENATGDSSDLAVKEGIPQRAYNAVIPIAVLIGTVAVGLYVTGEGDSIRDIIGSAETSRVLLWAGFLGVLVAVVMSVGQRLLTLGESMDAWYGGLKSVLFVMIILTLAWSLAAVAETLKTANYLVSVLGDALPPAMLPALLFVLAAAVSFAVGTSWGTMGILMPLAVPLVWTLLQNNGMADPEHYHIMYATIGTVLAGSVWGDHCSPISDTTIISSVAAGSDHIDHVRTQIPYALTVGIGALVFGLIPTGFGVPAWITLPVGAVALIGFLLVFGKKVDTESQGQKQQPVEEPAAEPASS